MSILTSDGAVDWFAAFLQNPRLESIAGALQGGAVSAGRRVEAAVAAAETVAVLCGEASETGALGHGWPKSYCEDLWYHCVPVPKAVVTQAKAILEQAENHVGRPVPGSPDEFEHAISVVYDIERRLESIGAGDWFLNGKAISEALANQLLNRLKRRDEIREAAENAAENAAMEEAQRVQQQWREIRAKEEAKIRDSDAGVIRRAKMWPVTRFAVVGIPVCAAVGSFIGILALMDGFFSYVVGLVVALVALTLPWIWLHFGLSPHARVEELAREEVERLKKEGLPKPAELAKRPAAAKKSSLTGMEFKEEVFKDQCREWKVPDDRVRKQLAQLEVESIPPPQQIWPLLEDTPIGVAVKEAIELFSHSRNFTGFCANLTEKSHCPADYYAGFWNLLIEKDDTPQDSAVLIEWKIESDLEVKRRAEELGMIKPGASVVRGTPSHAPENWAAVKVAGTVDCHECGKKLRFGFRTPWGEVLGGSGTVSCEECKVDVNTTAFFEAADTALYFCASPMTHNPEKARLPNHLEVEKIHVEHDLPA